MGQGVKLTRESARKVAAAVRQLQRKGRRLTGDAAREGVTLQETVWGRLTEAGTGDNAGRFAWEEVSRTTATAWAATDEGRTGTVTKRYAFEVNRGRAAVGMVVLLKRTPTAKANATSGADAQDEKDWQTCWGFQADGDFDVDLEEDGAGDAGDADTTCTFTYTAKIPGTSTVIGTSLSPVFQWRIRAMVAATRGRAQYKADGTLELLIANETFPAATKCATDGGGS